MPKCWSIEDQSSFFCLLSNCLRVGYDKLLFHERNVTYKDRFTLYGTTRRDKIFFHGSDMLELTLVRHRQLTTKTVSLRLREENNLPVC
jgi:hypothetical protein